MPKGAEKPAVQRCASRLGVFHEGPCQMQAMLLQRPVAAGTVVTAEFLHAMGHMVADRLFEGPKYEWLCCTPKKKFSWQKEAARAEAD